MSAIWFGPPGQLRSLPDPDPGVSASRDLTVATHEAVGGGALTADVTAPGWRAWTYTYTALNAEEADLVDLYRAGIYGPPPYVLLDPISPNRLDANQAAAGRITGTGDGFAVASGDVLAMVKTAGVIGPAALAWTITPGAASRVLSLPSRWAPPSTTTSTRAFPIAPDATVCLSVHVRSATPVPVRWRTSWWDADGVLIPATTHTVVTPVADTWTPLVAEATPPRGAVWVAPAVVTDTTTATGPTVLNADAFAMSYGAPLPAWRPGGGVPQVVITAWTTSYPYIGTVNGSLQLTEVG